MAKTKMKPQDIIERKQNLTEEDLELIDIPVGDIKLFSAPTFSAQYTVSMKAHTLLANGLKLRLWEEKANELIDRIEKFLIGIFCYHCRTRGTAWLKMLREDLREFTFNKERPKKEKEELLIETSGNAWKKGKGEKLKRSLVNMGITKKGEKLKNKCEGKRGKCAQWKKLKEKKKEIIVPNVVNGLQKLIKRIIKEHQNPNIVKVHLQTRSRTLSTLRVLPKFHLEDLMKVKFDKV